MSHWHDTPEFERLRDGRVDALLATDQDEATHCCPHFIGKPRVIRKEPMYFMRAPSGRTWFLCRECCKSNVTMELLAKEKAPSPPSPRKPGGAKGGGQWGCLTGREAATERRGKMALLKLAVFLLSLSLAIWANDFAYQVGEWNVGGLLSFLAGSLAGGSVVWAARASSA